MRLHDLLTPAGDVTFYTDGYRQLVESHYRYILEQGYLTVQSIDGQMAGKYHGDFYGLLDALFIPKKYQWATLFFNRYRHPGDYDQTTVSIVIPDVSFLDLLMQLYKTRKRLI